MIEQVVVFSGDAWEHVCPVIRILNPAERTGITVLKGNEWENTGIKVFSEHIRESDLVIIQRDFPVHADAYKSVIQTARDLHKPVIYELDDLLTELPEDHPGFDRYLPTRLAILQALLEADAAIGSTTALCNYLNTFNPNVYLLPNYLDEDIWKFRQPIKNADFRGEKDAVVIGYLGSSSHQPDLEMIVPTLLRLIQRYGNRLELRFWGMVPPPSLRKLNNVHWTQVGLVSYLDFAAYFQEQQCDLFIAPLQDNLFNRCKSSIKYLEYSALGIPGVYSRIEPYQRVVREGENGLLAASAEEWEAQLIRLIEDPQLRLNLAAAAQADVSKNWMLSDHANEWRDVWEKLSTQPAKTRTVSSSPSGFSASEAGLIAVEKAKTWAKDMEDRVVDQENSIRALTDQVSRLQVQLTGKDQAYQTAHSLYLEIMTSTGWKLMQRMFRIRQKLLPKGSKRENLVRMAVFSLQVLRREGIGAFMRGLSRRTRAVFSGNRSASAASEFQLSQPGTSTNIIVDGSKLPLPVISLLVSLDSAGTPPWVTASTGGPIYLDLIVAWLKKQTIPSEAVEVIAWDKTGQKAWNVNDTDNTWSAGTVKEALLKSFGRFVCLVSDDLLQQPETYLEENWIALETESLAFTINLRGDCPWGIEKIRQGLLPGDSENPLMRSIVAKHCLRDDFMFDVSEWVEGRTDIPNVLGKVLVHTTREKDTEELLPFTATLADFEWQLAGMHLLGRMPATHPWPRISRALHPLESVVPGSPLPVEKPTVLLVLQFLAVGGAEQLALHIINGLKNKMRFVVLSVDEMDPSLGTLADAFRQATPYVYIAPDFVDLDLRLSFFLYLIERYQCTTLYIANGACAIFDALPSIKKRYPDLRTVNQVYDSQIGWINRYDIELVTNLDAHIGANARICRAYLEKGARQESIYQVAHTIDVSHLNPDEYSAVRKAEIIRRLGLPEGKKVITFASRMNPQKRPMDFVELARRFSPEDEIVFLMIGEGQEAAAVDAAIAQIGLKNIYRHQFYRPISDILAITDVLVLPSEYEGMPLIMAETQAMGKPVVVTDVGNNQEVLALTEGGVVVPNIGDIQALAAGVHQMLETPPNPQRTRQAIIDHFSIEVIAEKYRRVFIGENE